MNPESIQDSLKRELKAINKLYPLGWTPKGNWIFEKDNTRYDLSCADLTRLDYIVKNKVFVVK